jgi:hypothetical protein
MSGKILIAILTCANWVACSKCDVESVRGKLFVYATGYRAHSDVIFVGPNDVFNDDTLYVNGVPRCIFIDCDDNRLEIEEVGGKHRRGVYSTR